MRITLMRSILDLDAKALKYPDYTHNFFNKIPMEFITVNAVPLDEQHKLGKRNVERLILHLTKLGINELSCRVYQKVQE
jgi:hypothetical protein